MGWGIRGWGLGVGIWGSWVPLKGIKGVEDYAYI